MGRSHWVGPAAVAVHTALVLLAFRGADRDEWGPATGIGRRALATEPVACISLRSAPGPFELLPGVRRSLVDGMPTVPGPAVPLRTELGPAPIPDARRPGFTRFTIAPHLLNGDTVLAAIEREYPITLREAGVGGTAEVWVRVGELGDVPSVAIHGSSGHAQLDEAALRVACTMVFTAARERDQVVAAWLSVPISFRVR
jgi:protein TonB